MVRSVRPILVILTVAAGLALGGCGARTFEAMGLLRDMQRPPDSALERVSRRDIAYAVNGREREADLYRPLDRPPRAGLVVVPGASPQGRDDPRLMVFAGALTRSGFEVLVPEIPNLRDLTLQPDDTRIVADAIRHLHERRAGEGRLGVSAISYAVGPALLATLEPDTESLVDFLIGIGGYYDSTAVITFFTTGYFRDPETGAWRHLEPNTYGKWVFVRSNLDGIESPDDRSDLYEIADRRLRDPTAAIDEIAARLGPEGRAVLTLLDNRAPERTPELVAALPDGVRADIAALDLSRHPIGEKAPRLLLIHGRGDAIVPYAESVRLARSVDPDGTGEQARVYLLDGLAHVDMEDLSLRDLGRLIGVIRRLLAERDRS